MKAVKIMTIAMGLFLVIMVILVVTGIIILNKDNDNGVYFLIVGIAMLIPIKLLNQVSETIMWKLNKKTK